MHIYFLSLRNFHSMPPAMSTLFIIAFVAQKTCHYPMDFTRWKLLYRRACIHFFRLHSPISFLRVAKSVVQITPGSLLVKHSSSIPVTCVYDGFFYTNDRMIESERFPPCIKRHFLYPAVTRLATWRCWRLGAHIRTLSFSLSISLLIHDCMCVSRVCSIGGSRIGLHKGCN